MSSNILIALGFDVATTTKGKSNPSVLSIMEERGKFVCEPNDQGMHGDCFDADKLAGDALTAAASRSTIVPPMHLMYPLDPSEEERVWS